MALFDAYNVARTYDEVKPLVSGVLAQQFAAVASRDSNQVPSILAQQQLASYRPRVVDIDGANSFLVLEQVRSKAGREMTSQAYLVAKSSGGTWTLANRMMPDSIIKSLWTRRFRPSDFVQAASCVIDGHEFPTRSALAIRRGDSIDVSLYPFELTQADLDYWSHMSGVPAAGSGADSHFSHRVPTICRAIVKIDNAGRPSLLNVGFGDQSGALARSSLWQPPKPDSSRVVYQDDVIELVTSGAVGADRNGFRWNVNIKVPVWQQGL